MTVAKYPAYLSLTLTHALASNCFTPACASANQSVFSFWAEKTIPFINFATKESAMENISDRITIDSALLNGKPTIRGKRIAVQTILEFLCAGDTAEDILNQYPSLEADDIKASLQFAAELMNRNYTFKSVA